MFLYLPSLFYPAGKNRVFNLDQPSAVFMLTKSISIDTGVFFLSPQVPKAVESI
jgi:hypothetical protein